MKKSSFLGLLIIFFLVLLLTIITIAINFSQKKYQLPGRAVAPPVLQVDSLTADSNVVQQNSTVHMSLYNESQGYLYKTNQSGAAAVTEFLTSDPEYQAPEPSSADNVKGVSNTNKKLIPKDFIKNSRLIRAIKDRDDRFITIVNNKLNGEHFFYNQKINNIPVYGAGLAVHLRNNNEIYSVAGDLVTNKTVTQKYITEDQAKAIALKRAETDVPLGIKLIIAKTEEYIINKQILGLSSDTANFLTLAVTINSETAQQLFSQRYFVELQTGQIVFVENLIQTSLNRRVYDCSTGGCSLSRTEGAAPVSNNGVDNTYNILGNTYNYFFNNFQRDSFDNNGAALTAQVNYNAGFCPNAAWDGQKMIICSGMEANDIVAHELAHAVTQRTANLLYQNQSGALNEAISDIFGYAIDPDDWLMGEDSVMGVIRDMSDPTKSRTRQPDRLFSSNYYCSSGDNGGVHINNGVMIKAFYLMTAGGTFNSCSIAGITKEKSHPIVYRALTTYLQSTSNFKAMYNSLIQSCTDLYPNETNTCNSVRAALQATEMDQQPDGQSSSPVCQGAGGSAPACAGSLPTGGLTPSVTSGPTMPPNLSPTISPTVVPTGGLTPTSIPVSTINLNFKLRFQGIFKKPKDELNRMTVNITVYSPQIVSPTPTPLPVDFVADDNGVWSGSGLFSVPAGPGYIIYVKGPKHIQKKICDNLPQESYPGTYSCRVDRKVTINQDNNLFDFSSISLLVGDLPEQDGIVNSYDTSLIINNLGKNDNNSLKLADLNFDGIVDTQDYSLIIAALSIRYDEQ